MLESLPMRGVGLSAKLARFAIGAGVLLACQSGCGSKAANPDGGGGAAGTNSGGAGGGGGGGGSTAGNAGGGTGGSVDAGDASTVAACTPPTPQTTADCTNAPTTLGVPNEQAVYSETYVLPSPLLAGADNAFSFLVTGSGPFDFELWGSNTPCHAEELLWWGPLNAGTQCAQFRPSKPYANIIWVQRQLYVVSTYSFGTPWMFACVGGTCPAWTTGTGKVSDAPLTAPIGNYEYSWVERMPGGWDITMGRTGRMTVAYAGAMKKSGEVQPLSAGVFRAPATDPYGDAWYCIGDGSTLTYNEAPTTSVLKGFQVALRNVTRLGACGATPGSGSLSAMFYLSATSATQFAADITGTISAWTGANLPTNQYCAGPYCNLRFRGSPQQHFVHISTMQENLGIGTTAPVPITSTEWFMQASDSQPFSMACSSEGTFNYGLNDPSTLQLAKVTGPLACPGTAIPNNQLDMTIER